MNSNLETNNSKLATVSIQGQPASYSHIAAQFLFGRGIELICRDSFDEMFDDLASKKVDYIVSPIENSTYGSIFKPYDLIMKNDFQIIKEVYLKISFHLISFPGNKIEDINELYTHQVAIGQIQGFLKAHPKIKVIEHPDTAGAVKMIVGEKHRFSQKNVAAAASRMAADYYEMEILQENIHENKNNYTRFFALTRPENIPTLHDNVGEDHDLPLNKTSLEFELGEEAGTLFKALEPFAKRDIALIKIESRPIINTHWQFKFYIDVKAGINDPKMQDALKELEKVVSTYRILGSYRKGEYIET